MKKSLIKEKRSRFKIPFNLTKVVLILFCLLNISAVYIFIWHVEITMDFKPGVYLEDGYRTVDPIQAYHNHMYMLLFFTIANTLVILLNVNRISNYSEVKKES